MLPLWIKKRVRVRAVAECQTGTGVGDAGADCALLRARREKRKSEARSVSGDFEWVTILAGVGLDVATILLRSGRGGSREERGGRN
jgi:hypothetical protein